MTAETAERMEDAIVRAAEATAAQIRTARANISTVIFGQQAVVDRALITVLSGGHALLVGLPASPRPSSWRPWARCSASTRAASSSRPTSCPPTSSAPRCSRRRPAAAAPSASSRARFRPAAHGGRDQPRLAAHPVGAAPVHAGAPGDGGGESYELPRPFHVLATQNPLEQEGTYPLPEAQLDRFLMQIDVDYPTSMPSGRSSSTRPARKAPAPSRRSPPRT